MIHLFFQSIHLSEISNRPLQTHVEIHGRKSSNFGYPVLRWDRASALEQGQVRSADREPEERLRQRARALRHDESRPKSRLQRFWNRDSPRLAFEVMFMHLQSPKYHLHRYISKHPEPAKQTQFSAIIAFRELPSSQP